MLIWSGGQEIIIKCELVAPGNCTAVRLGMQDEVLSVRGIIHCVVCPLCIWSGQVKVPVALYNVSYPRLIVIAVNN